MEQEEINALKSSFRQELPDQFFEVLRLQQPDEAAIRHLSQIIDEFYSKSLGMGGNSVKPFQRLSGLLQDAAMAKYFILHPEKLILTIETILANVRFGANNVFFTLGLEKVAELFVQNPEIFLDLAEKTKEESIGAFPSLKGNLLFHRFKENPEQVIESYERIVKLLDYNAGLVLNELYKDDFALCFTKDSAHFIHILSEIAEKYADDYLKQPFTAFQKKAFLEKFIQYFENTLSREGFYQSLEANS